jgi:large subunit ribosomal protein L10
MPSEKVLNVKKEVVSEIREKVNNSSSVIFFDYRGLSVAETVELRSKLREIKADVKVYKNTLVKRALDNLKINLENVLEGPNAMSFSTNVIEPIKILTDYAKEHKALEIKGGIIDGNPTSISEIATLATIPSRDGLLTMLAGGMIGIVKDLSICLHLYSEQKNE